MLSYVIEYIAREKFMYSNDELSRFYLSGVTEEAGWVRFSFSDGERNNFDIRADGFFPTYVSIANGKSDCRELADVTSIYSLLQINKAKTEQQED